MGYSETLDKELGKIVSLGDVLRCSVILEALKNKYPDAEITWLISEEAFPLLKGIPYVDRFYLWDAFIPYVLMREQYDMVINLEKIHGICALTDTIDAWEKVGFRFNSQTGDVDTYMNSMIAKEYIANKESQGTRMPWQEIFLKMLGLEWKEQEYALGYQKEQKEQYDIGFNYQVGSKWPSKAMLQPKWKELETLLTKEGFSISWQQGLSNLEEYMGWVNTCRVIITNDSLGLHVALALKKQVIALFGSTDEKEIYFYGRGIAVIPQTPYSCLPCYSPLCDKEIHCMDFIDLNKIVANAKQYLSNKI